MLLRLAYPAWPICCNAVLMILMISTLATCHEVPTRSSLVTVNSSSQGATLLCSGSSRRFKLGRDDVESWRKLIDTTVRLCQTPATIFDVDGAQVSDVSLIDEDDTLIAHAVPEIASRCQALLNFRGAVFATDTKLGQRCAVVGSSGAATSRPFGPEIDDAHDVVIRLNENPSGAGQEGSELAAKVGTRTTVRLGAVTNDKNRIPLLSPAADRNHTVVRYRWPWKPELEETARCRYEDQPCDTITQDFLEHAATVVSLGAVLANKLHYDAATGQAVTLKPSTGFIAILAALHGCSTVDVYGFQLCRADDARATPICQPRQAGTTPAYFCKYYEYGAGWRKDRCSRFDHAFALEHNTLHQLHACGHLTVWT